MVHEKVNCYLFLPLLVFVLGLKPGQRKVIFTAFKRYEKKEVKVAQMAGAVSEISAYHHGEVRP